MVKFFDRVKETSATIGIGSLALSGPATGYRSFSSVLSDGDTCYYTVTEGAQWEVGLGTYRAGVLTRSTVLSSSNSSLPINLTVGAADVFLDLPASYITTGEQTSNKGIASGYAGLDESGEISVYAAPRPISASLARIFDPATYFDKNGLVAWIDARTYPTHMTDDGGGLLSSVVDRVGGIVFTASGSGRPTYNAALYNGNGGIVGDGANTFLTAASVPAALSGASIGEIWILGTCTSGSAAVGVFCSIGGTGAATKREVRKSASYKTQVTDGSTTESDTRVSLVDQTVVIRVQFLGTQMNMWINDFACATNPTSIATLATGTTRWRLLANNSTTPANFILGSFCHQMFFSRALTDDEAHLNFCWLANQGNIPDVIGPDNYYSQGALSVAGQTFFDALPAYFRPADAAATLVNGLRVHFQAAAVPSSNAADETTVAQWPATDFISQDTALLAASTYTNGRLWFLNWTNRCNNGTPNIKPNPIYPAIKLASGKECRVEYDSLAKAAAATLVHLMHALGVSSATYNAVADAAGFNHATDIISRATLAASPATYFTGLSAYGGGQYATALNKIWLVDTLLPAGLYGVMADYECQDGRVPSFTTSHVTDLVNAVQGAGKKFMLYPNRLDGPSSVESGIDATNAAALLGLVDYFGYIIQAGVNVATSFAAQTAISGFAAAKTVPVFDCESSMLEATDLRSLILANGIHAVQFWPDGNIVGGSDPTQGLNPLINRIVFGV